jgi:hypothetical protein
LQLSSGRWGCYGCRGSGYDEGALGVGESRKPPDVSIDRDHRGTSGPATLPRPLGPTPAFHERAAVGYGDEVRRYVREYGLDRIIPFEDAPVEKWVNERVDPDWQTAYLPEWEDLVRLHQLILERRVTTVLEFGVGKSTLVMAHALSLNAERHGEFVRTRLRRHNAFELHSVDDLQKFVDLTASQLPRSLRASVHFHLAAVSMGTFQDRVCTYYDPLPDLAPDFIYLDGPSQASARGSVRGLSTRHPDRLPMAADILVMEPFLLPGTMILVDGRSANARFLESNLQRRWHYQHREECDVHVFELREPPLGKLNRAQIEYCLGSAWLRAV